MAFSADEGYIPGQIATGNLSAKQFYILRYGTTAGTVAVAVNPNSDAVMGILQNDPTDGREALVQFTGVARVAAETGISRGAQLTCSSTGRAKTTTTDGDKLIGRAIQGSSSAGDIISVALGLGDLYLS